MQKKISMRIIIKHTIKNMISKPMRTLLLLFCIIVCSFTAMLSVDMTGTMDQIFASLFGQLMGTTDIVFSSNNEVYMDMFEELPEHTVVLMPTYSNTMTKRSESSSLYSYVDAVDIAIFSMDFKDAYEMKLFDKEYNLAENEMIISDEMAEEFDLAVGDSFALYDTYEEPFDFIVTDIISKEGLFTQQSTAIISLDAMRGLKKRDELASNEALIDIKDSKRVEEAQKQLEEAYPNDNVMALNGVGDLKEASQQIAQMFFVLFAFCMLIVLFITITASEKIVIERMSVIGTLRSLGVSNGKTAAILLTENSAYGLLGSGLGVWLYSKVRLPMLNALFSFEGTDLDVSLDFGHTKGYVYLLVILLTILIEDLCPLKSILHATKRSIRDIIFDNQDTEYHMSDSTKKIGFGLIVVALISAFFTRNFAAMIICLGSTVGALSVFFPYVIKWVSELLQKFFAIRNKPIAHLAAIEIYSKKSNVGSARLAVTATSIALLLYIVSTSLGEYYHYICYQSDLIVDCKDEKADMYSYMAQLDGVHDVEFLYRTTDFCQVNAEEDKMLSIYGLNDYKAFQGVLDLPENLHENEFAMDRYYAEKLHLAVGDEVEVTLASKSFIPIKKTLKLVGLCNTSYSGQVGDGIVISQKLYLETYRDYPLKVLLKCDEPEKIKAKIEQYSAGTVGEILTYEEYEEEVAQSNRGMNTLLYALIVMSIALTLIGTASNQFVGFQGRRRECAVLLSTAMPRKLLARLFTYETALSMLIVMIVACPMSLLLSQIVKNLMAILKLNIPIVFSMTILVKITLVIWVIFLSTALFPRRSLRKMKIAEQLKYE